MMCPYIGIRHERGSSGFARERARSLDGRVRVRLPLPSSASGSAAARNVPIRSVWTWGGRGDKGSATSVVGPKTLPRMSHLDVIAS